MEQLIKKRDLLKSVVNAFGIIFLIGIVVLLYILTIRDVKKVSIAVFVPLFTFPITLLPVLISLSNVNTEIKSRIENSSFKT